METIHKTGLIQENTFCEIKYPFECVYLLYGVSVVTQRRQFNIQSIQIQSALKYRVHSIHQLSHFHKIDQKKLRKKTTENHRYDHYDKDLNGFKFVLAFVWWIRYGAKMMWFGDEQWRNSNNLL